MLPMTTKVLPLLKLAKKDTANKDDNDEDEVSFLDEKKSNYAVIIE